MTVAKYASLRWKHLLTRLAPAAAALAAVALFSACSRTEQKPIGPPEKVTIAFSATQYALLADVAQQKGYFLQEGLEVTPRLHTYGKLALRDMIEGNADFATVAETPLMFAIMNGANISIISTIHTSSKDNAIVARKDKGILTPGDLKGRKIAATFGTTSEFFMDAFLAVNGISRKNVALVNLRQEELPQALAEGTADAAAVFNPFLIASQKKLGENGTTFYNKNIYTQTFNIVSTKEFVRNNPGKVGKVLRALDRAENFFRQNPEEALKIVADFNRMDMAEAREMLAGTSIGLSLDQSLLLSLEDESRWAIKNGLTASQKVPNYLDYIYFDGLKAVKPNAVRILR
jgi:sulfonate transport system substrate-binding protein